MQPYIDLILSSPLLMAATVLILIWFVLTLIKKMIKWAIIAGVLMIFFGGYLSSQVSMIQSKAAELEELARDKMEAAGEQLEQLKQKAEEIIPDN